MSAAQVQGLAEAASEALDLLHGPGNDYTHHLKAMVAEAMSLTHKDMVHGSVLAQMAALMERAGKA